MTTTDNQTRLANLGATVARLRIARGDSQASFAQKIGISRRAMSSLEQGAIDPTLANLINISCALGVDLNYLSGIDVGTVRKLFRSDDIPLGVWDKYVRLETFNKKKVADEINFLFRHQQNPPKPRLF